LVPTTSVMRSFRLGSLLQFSLLIVAAMAATYSRFAMGPLQEAMRSALSLSDNQMALLQGPALAIPIVIAAAPLGRLIDRYSRARLLLMFSVLNALGSLWTAMATKFVFLFLARCIVGLAVSAISATVFCLVADLFAAAERGRASMLVVVSQYVGMSAVFALGGALLVVLGAYPSGWREVMLWLTGPLGGVALAMLAMREPPRAGADAAGLSVRETYVRLIRGRAALVWFMAAMVWAEMAVVAELTWAAPAFARSMRLEPQQIGAIMAVALLVSGVIGPIAGGLLADLCHRSGGPQRTSWVLSSLAILAAPAGCFALAPGVASASCLLLLFMMIIGATLVAGIAVLTIVIPAEYRGLGMATLAGAQVLFGVAVAPVLVSLLSGMLGGPATIGRALSLVVLTTSALTAASFAIGRRFLPARNH
jgi:MFS family permease